MNKNLNLFLTFLKIGAFTFGGGYAMISIIKNEIVDKKQWISNDELIEITAIAESTPGPIAINVATFVGYKINKFIGSLLATLGVILPSMIIIYIISLFFNAFISNEYVGYAFLGIKCAVAFLIIKAGIGLFKSFKKNWLSFVIFSLVFVSMILFEIFNISFSTIYLILIGGILGLIYYSISYRAIIRKENNKL